MSLQPRSGKALLDLVHRAGWRVDERGPVSVVRPPGGGAPIPVSEGANRQSAAMALSALRRAGLERALETAGHKERRRREANGREHERGVERMTERAEAQREAHEREQEAERVKREQAEAVAWIRERRQREREDQERAFGLLTAQEVADVLGVTTGSVADWIRKGALPAETVPHSRRGYAYRVRWEAVVAFDEAHPAAPNGRRYL